MIREEKQWTDFLRLGLLVTPFIWVLFSLLFNIWSWNGFFQVFIMNIIWVAWTLDIRRLEMNKEV